MSYASQRASLNSDFSTGLRMPQRKDSTRSRTGSTDRQELPGETPLEQRLRSSAAHNRLLAERDSLQEQLKEVITAAFYL